MAASDMAAVQAVRGGDDDDAALRAFWTRVMHTRAVQWRFLNSVALRQLAVQQSRACDQLATLHATLSNLQRVYVTLVHKLSQTLSKSALHSVAPRASTLVHALDRLQYDRLRADVRASTRCALPLARDAARLSHLLNAFLTAAARFMRHAHRLRLPSHADLAHLVHGVADSAADQPSLITDAAQAIHRAATLSERHRSRLLVHNQHQL